MSLQKKVTMAVITNAIKQNLGKYLLNMNEFNELCVAFLSLKYVTRRYRTR